MKVIKTNSFHYEKKRRLNFMHKNVQTEEQEAKSSPHFKGLTQPQTQHI